MKGNRTYPPIIVAVAGLVLALMLLISAATRAAEPISYQIQPIAKQGDTVGEIQIRADAYFEIGTLNDNGQLVFLTANAAGGEALIQYSEGKFMPIVAAGEEAPTGAWPRRIAITFPPSSNQAGNVVFSAFLPGSPPGLTAFTTYLWDFQAQKVTTLAEAGMPATGDFTFATGGWLWAPVINNRNDIALQAMAYPGSRAESKGLGVFLLAGDGTWQAVAVGDQALPGGGTVASATQPSLNDARLVALTVVRREDVQGETVRSSAYLWEQGTLTPVARAGAELPGGERIVTVHQVWVNNQDGTVLVAVRLRNNSVALYRFAGGQLSPVMVPGQELPGGGKLRSVGWPYASFPNEAGQQAIVADGEDGAMGLYLLEPDGRLSLILKTGMTSDLGTITHLGNSAANSTGVGLNRRGQVAVPVRIENGPAMIVLLTPSGP